MSTDSKNMRPFGSLRRGEPAAAPVAKGKKMAPPFKKKGKAKK